MKFSSSCELAWALLAVVVGGCAAPDGHRDIARTDTTKQLFGYEFRGLPTFGSTRYFEYSRESEEIQVTIIKFNSAEEAQIFMEDRLFQFRSVFEPKRVDYPGQFSRSIECAPELKPAYFRKSISAGRLEYFTGYVGANKVAGVCAVDLVKYRHIYALAFCESANYLLEIERYTSMAEESPDGFIRRVSCDDLKQHEIRD